MPFYMCNYFKLLVFSVCLGWCWISSVVVAQPSLPNRSIIVSATQSLYFGEFSVVAGSSGGTVIVNQEGIRSSTGQIVLINSGNIAHQAIFELKLCPGRSVQVNYDTIIQLNGSNGGNLMLELGPTNFGRSGSVFFSNLGCDDTHHINVGGILHVESMSSNPPGAYSGVFYLTIIQQ